MNSVNAFRHHLLITYWEDKFDPSVPHPSCKYLELNLNFCHLTYWMQMESILNIIELITFSC